MNNVQVLKWGLVALVLMNLVLMVFVWRLSHHEPGLPPMREPDITRVFDFNADQVRRFEQSKQAHGERMRGLQHELTEKSITYYRTALKSPGSADSLMAEIHSISQQIYQNNLSHFTDISEICTPEQRKNIDGFIASLVRRPPPPRRQ